MALDGLAGPSRIKGATGGVKMPSLLTWGRGGESYAKKFLRGYSIWVLLSDLLSLGHSFTGRGTGSDIRACEERSMAALTGDSKVANFGRKVGGICRSSLVARSTN